MSTNMEQHEENIARIANAVQCHSLLSGNKDCHGFRFSIFRIVISVSNVTSPLVCLCHCLCICLCHCLFFGQVMSPHHSGVALCFFCSGHQDVTKIGWRRMKHCNGLCHIYSVRHNMMRLRPKAL